MPSDPASNVSCELNDHNRIRGRFLRRGSEVAVFIHGLGCSMDYYDCVWDSKELKEYSLLTVDLLGFGSSDKPQQFAYKLEQQAENLLCFLKRLDIDAFNLIGHSMGGAIGTLLLGSGKVRSFMNIEGNLTKLDGALISQRTAAIPEQSFVDQEFSKFKQEFPDLPEGYFSLRRCSPLAFHRSACSLVTWSDSGKLLWQFNSFVGPKCYMYGDKNADAPSLPLLIEAQTVSIPGSGHFPMIDNPTEFCRRTAQFIKQSVG